MDLTWQNRGVSRDVFLSGGPRAFTYLAYSGTSVGLWPLPPPSEPAAAG